MVPNIGTPKSALQGNVVQITSFGRSRPQSILLYLCCQINTEFDNLTSRHLSGDKLNDVTSASAALRRAWRSRCSRRS